MVIKAEPGLLLHVATVPHLYSTVVAFQLSHLSVPVSWKLPEIPDVFVSLRPPQCRAQGLCGILEESVGNGRMRAP